MQEKNTNNPGEKKLGGDVDQPGKQGGQIDPGKQGDFGKPGPGEAQGQGNKGQE